MESLMPDERAYELLKWQALAPLSEFDEAYPYATVQRKRSDAALDAWDKEHPFETSSELAAFRELERLGVFTQSDFYSPSKAANGYYTQRLNEHRSADARLPVSTSSTRRNSDQPGAGARLDGPDARKMWRASARTRRQRR